MAQYEMVREIPNLCRNNQMRDIFFSEIDTEDPEQYVRDFLKQEQKEISVEKRSDGTIIIFAVAEGLTQKFIFSPV